MSKRFMKLIRGLVAVLLCVSLPTAFAGEDVREKNKGPLKTATNDDYSWFTINNLFNWYGNNGNSSYNIATGNSGTEFPKGSGKTAIFEDGVLWGGFHKENTAVNPKVGGDTYRYGLQAGTIVTEGGPLEADRATADNPDLAKYRVYTVRPDVTPTTAYADVQAAMEEEAGLIDRYSSMTPQTLFARYQADWLEWPAKDGLPAPYKDVNGNGIYDPAVDVPGQPGADQTLYYVANDLNATRTSALYSSPPVGIEMHRTVWGYNLTGALGSTIFASTLLINKSGAPIDSCFLVQWSDVDLGEASDDYAGCDIGRSLGFVYNGRNVDLTYGSAVPATGYDFFQGPIIPTGNQSDSAVFQLKYRHGYKNLGMTTFDFFINSSAIYTDPTLGAQGSNIQWYRLMNARISSSGDEFIDPTTGVGTKYTLSGDPLTGKGWLDGTYGLIPGDRRICLVTGPFTLANRDTQELVVATLVGLGGDRISSIAVLKYYSDLAQSAYNLLFNISRPPPNPVVQVAQLDGEVALSWSDTVGSTKIETWNSNGYIFEGYNVYQYPTLGGGPDLAHPIRLATYDLVNSVTTVFDDQFDEATGYIVSKPAQYGTDSGIKRSFQTKDDAVGRRSLINGSTYYFGVTSYSFNGAPTAKPSQLEGPPSPKTVVPQTPPPGFRFFAAGDTVATVQSVATGGSLSEGLVMPIVVNPNATTGHQYRVNFRVDTVTSTTVWDLTDVTANRVLISGNTNQSGDENYPIVDGMLMKVTGPSTPGMKDWSIPSGSRRWTWAGGADGFGLEGFNGAIGNAYGNWFSGSTVGYDKLRNVLLKYAATDLLGNLTDPNDPDASFAYRYLRGATAAPAKPEFAPFILNPTAGYAFQQFAKSVPFAAYNNETTPPTRLAIGHLENNVAGGLVDGKYWPPDFNVGNNVSGSGPREWFFIYDVPYSTTADPSLQVDILNNTVPIMWMGTPARRGDVAFAANDEFLILANHLNTPLNSFSFTAPAAPTLNNAVAAADVENLNVFPNPYIGFNPQESNKYQRFVTFTHMPRSAIIRIFNLAGVLVRTLKKDDASQFLQWDLRNEQGFPVAAGMYIVYVDMPEVGKVKTLKLGVIPEQQFIDKW
ncbi:MAG: T9SS type A sorting domain-containing protein [Bacteroidota bacterium]